MKKTSILILVLVLALGAIGVGYAAWSQTLEISGDVTAASFAVDITNATTPTVPTEGTASAVIDAGGKSVALTVGNAYPGWSGDFVITVTNSSTIPVEVLVAETGDSEGLFSISPDTTQSIASGSPRDYTVSVSIPTSWDDDSNQGATFSVLYTLTANQNP